MRHVSQCGEKGHEGPINMQQVGILGVKPFLVKSHMLLVSCFGEVIGVLCLSKYKVSRFPRTKFNLEDVFADLL